jgi:hypothetical protein
MSPEKLRELELADGILNAPIYSNCAQEPDYLMGKAGPA